MRTGIKLLIILGIFLLAGYIEAKAETVPVLEDQKKIPYSRLEETYSMLTGLKTTSTADSKIRWEVAP